MIKSVKKAARNEFKKLKRYQSGEFKPVVTNRPWLDDIFGGLLPGDIVTVAGQSGGGKTFENQRLKNAVMSKEFNPNSDNFIWLDYSLEMRLMSTIIRDLNRVLKKSKKDVVSQEFTEDEKQLARDYSESLLDERFFIEENVLTLEEFKTGLFEFLEYYKDKEGVFISIDHIALFKGAAKETVDGVVEVINEARKTYTNTYWVILSQMNRNILGRIKDKDMMALPNRGDVFQSDTMFFISDYLYVSHNPYRLGMKHFLKVNAEQYDYLKEHFSENKNGKASFETLGKIFYIVLKAREAEVLFDDIFIEDVEVKNKAKYKTFDSTEEEGETQAPKFDSVVEAPAMKFETAGILGAQGFNFEKEE
jgi:replicative DNA helicase